MIYDINFENSYKELCQIFDGEAPYCMKRAEYLIENAYYGGTISYQAFCKKIDVIVNRLKTFIDINNLNQYRTAPNYALYEYFTRSSPLNGYSPTYYDFDDPMGLNDFSVFFTSRVIDTHKGQCASMSLLYKILCDELGGHSRLAFGPMHLYIKHIGEDGGG